MNNYIKTKENLITIINFNIKFKVNIISIYLDKNLLSTLDELCENFKQIQYDIITLKDKNEEFEDIQILL